MMGDEGNTNMESDAAMASGATMESQAAAAAVSSSSAAAAAASSSSTAAAASSSSPSDSMGDAVATADLSPLEQLKVNVGKFSQELSRRLTHGGTRTLATLNSAVIKRAAFSRKNRA
jgi:hypothetical protein